jgi:hypothetical protein
MKIKKDLIIFIVSTSTILKTFTIDTAYTILQNKIEIKFKKTEKRIRKGKGKKCGSEMIMLLKRI